MNATPCRPTILCNWLFTTAVCALAVVSASDALAEVPTSAGDGALFERLDANGNAHVSADEISPEHERLFARLVHRGDSNDDGTLSRDEFLAGLVPSRPEKPMEAKQPATLPQADAMRFLLLTMDTNGNSWIEANEVPEDLLMVFDALAERVDRNKNDVLETIELGRSGGPLAQIAGRYVARERVNVAAELKKLEKLQGRSVDRFDQQRSPMEMLADPKQARTIFGRLDGNGDGRIEPKEAPEPFKPQIERFMRFADRDRDGGLSEREFLAAARRVSQTMPRRDKPAKKLRDAQRGGESMPSAE